MRESVFSVGGKLLQIYNLSQAYRIRRITPAIPITVRRYGQLSKQGQKENSLEGKADQHEGKKGHVDHPAERAASTAEDFRRVAEAKARQGFASQTVEKAADGFQEAAVGDSSFESVKESFKEPPGKGNFHKTDDERNPLEK